ncbi:MAG: ECF transporter S component [Clostridia bacterium]
MSNSINKTRKMTITAILSAVSSVLMFFSINVPLMPSFIKLDLSDLPAVFAAFALGPVSGVVVCLVKNVVNLFFSTTAGIGEISNFLLGSSFVLITGLIYKKHKTKKGAIIGSVLGALVMALFSVVTNFFIVYPIYFNFLPLDAILGMYNVINPFVGTEPTNENLLKALITFNMPFTFIKGMLSVIITFLIYKPLSPVIHEKNL